MTSEYPIRSCVHHPPWKVGRGGKALDFAPALDQLDELYWYGLLYWGDAYLGGTVCLDLVLWSVVCDVGKHVFLGCWASYN